MRRKEILLMIMAAVLLGGCGAAGAKNSEEANPETESAVVKETEEKGTETALRETEEETEVRQNITKEKTAGPELEAYASYLFEEGYLGENADRDLCLPKLIGTDDARFLLRDIDGDGVMELYLCGTMEDEDTFYPAYCFLDYTDGRVEVLSEQYYQQRMVFSFLNNNYFCRYEEGMADEPFCYPEDRRNGYNPTGDEWSSFYDDLYLWSPDPAKEDIHLSTEGGGYHRGDQYVPCYPIYVFNGEEITEEEYLELENRYTEDATIPASEFRTLSKENLLAWEPGEDPADKEAGENDADLLALLEGIEGNYADLTNPEIPRSFTIGRSGMEWYGGYPVTIEDVVDYGEDYVLFQEAGGSYYKVTITKDALFINYGKTPAAISESAVIDRSTRRPL